MVEMIPKINGEERREEGRFVLPKDEVRVFGAVAYMTVLEDRLAKIGLRRKWNYVEWKERETAAIRFNMLPKEEHEEKLEEVEGAYVLYITPEQVKVTSHDPEGLTNGLTTLYWMLREGGGACGCGTFTDAPACGYRGILIDSSRHFFDVETIKGMIEQCSLRKLNRLHWHLSDDQGYRLESLRFPRLNEVGSWRKEPDGSTYGGFYTKAEVHDIVSYAGARGMQIIPEIDVPGHVSAILAAYPRLSCSREEMEVKNMPGIHERILCAGDDLTLQCVNILLDEAMEMFPYPWFHVGGDEAPKSEWKKCPACQERIRAEGLKDEEELQAWFIKKVVEHLQEKGRTAICWNECMKSGMLDSRAVVQYWDEEEDAGYCRELAEGDRKCVYSYTPAFYFDYEPMLTPMRRMRNWKPVLRDGSQVAAKNLLGVEAAFWSERIADRERLEKLAFPRLFAVAEAAWNGLADYGEFVERCAKHMRALDEDGVRHYSMDEVDLEGEAQKEAIIKEWKPMVDQARAAGMGQFLDVIGRLVRNKLEGVMDEAMIEEMIEEIRS